jgi:UDP-3-O-[3-hydroxymyristoyl] glucosamine N-acyltransferase
VTLKELAGAIGAELEGDPGIVITGVGTLEEATTGQVTFLANPKYLKQLETTSASAVIVAPSVKIDRLPLLKAKDPYYAFALAVRQLMGERKHPFAGIHPRATVDPTAAVGEGTVVYPGAYIGPRVRVGRDCVLYANVVIYEDCVIGDRVVIHANTAIGPDGFGFASNGGIHHKIPQIGNVIVEDDVEIGANCSIDRAALGSTVIGKGSKLNDLIAIGHNTKMGPHCLIVSQVGIAGSATIGHHVTLAGQVGVAGHIEVGDNVTVGAQAGVTNSVPEQSVLLGSPAMPIRQARRVAAVFVQLPELQDRVKKLEQAVEELSKDDESPP